MTTERERERGKKERNSVLRDDRKRWRVAYSVSWLVAAPLSFTLPACSLTVAVLHTHAHNTGTVTRRRYYL